ncbi:Blue-sensitive opsin, partial [Bienertia sinuspersici]
TVALLLVLLPINAFGDSEKCSQVSCGKGTCKSKPDYIPHGFVCECESGWRRTRLSDNEEQYLQFLSCIIPNCALGSDCSNLGIKVLTASAAGPNAIPTMSSGQTSRSKNN